MGIYIVFFWILCFFAIINFHDINIKIKGLAFTISCGIIMFLICFRDVSVGADTLNYCTQFEKIQTYPWTSLLDFNSWEPGILLIMKIISVFFKDYRAYIIIMGIVDLIPVMLFIKKKSVIPVMSLLVFYVTLFTSAMYLYRAWLAAIILLSSYKYVIERRFLRFLICVMFAALFHRSALVFLIVYFLYKIKINNCFIICAAIVSITLKVTASSWLSVFNRFARIELNENSGSGYTMLLFLWAVFLVAYYISYQKRKENEELKLFLTLLLFAAATQPLATTFSLWSRVVLFFRIPLVFLIPQVYIDLVGSGNNRKLSIIIELLIYILLFGYYLSTRIYEFVLMQFP